MKSIRSIALILALFAPLAALAQHELHSALQVLISPSATPEQHAAVAQVYHEQAAGAREDAEMHRKMAIRYGTAKPNFSKVQKQHCNSLAKMYDEIAAEYEKLAATHEAQAKQP